MSLLIIDKGAISMRIHYALSTKYTIILAIAFLVTGYCTMRYVTQNAITQYGVEILKDIENASPKQLIQYTVWAYNNKNYEVAERLSIVNDGMNFDNWRKQYKVISIKEVDAFEEYKQLKQQFDYIKQYKVKLSYANGLFVKGYNIRDFIFVYDKKDSRWYLYGIGSY